MHTTENKTTNSPSPLTHNAAGQALFFQPKLTINAPGDQYEQEADGMADHVTRMPINDLPFFKPSTAVISRLQRKCRDCEDDEKMQRKESSSQPADAGGEVSSYISSLSSKGSPLPDNTRNFFEPRFGQDFSDVRIHNDADAMKSSESVNALAYTVDNNIVFNQNQFSPDSDSGKKLLAHELTHVVQQSGSGKNIQRQEKTDPPWLDPSFKGDLPGERVPGLGPFRKVDLRNALKRREAENKKNVAFFLKNYIESAITIFGTYLTSEMSAAAKQSVNSIFARFLQFAFIQTLQLIAEGGVGVFITPLVSKGAVKALKFLANWSAGFISGEEVDAANRDIASDEIDKREAALNKITAAFAKNTAELTSEMIMNLGGDDIDLATWLERADNKDLDRFRIPELFPAANPQAIKSTIAGVVAGLAHGQYICKGGLLQCGMPMAPVSPDIVKYYGSGPTQFYDDNIIIIHLSDITQGTIIDAEFYSTSKVLSKEIVGKATISLLPSVPLFIIVFPSESLEELNAGKVMNGVRFGNALPDDTKRLRAAYPKPQSQMIIKRNTDGKLTVDGGGLEQHLWLYSLASGLTYPEIGNYLEDWKEGENLNLPKNPNDEPAVSSELITPEKIAEKAYMLFPNALVDGAQKFINMKVLSQTPSTPEDRTGDGYWIKPGHT